MRAVVVWFSVVLLFALFIMAGQAAHSSPSTGPAGLCGMGCNGSPAPTAAPTNGVACTYTPPASIPFAASLLQIGKTNDGNNTCVPNHQYTEIQIDGKDCTAACTNGSPPPAGFNEPNLGAYRVDAYADFAEDTIGFGAGSSNQICEMNYPYNVGGTESPPFNFPSGFGPPINGACKPFKYQNPNVLHANEADAVPNQFACTNAGSTINMYGTPTNPQAAPVPGVLGDKTGAPTPGPSNDYDDIEHLTPLASPSPANIINDRIYVTPGGCSSSNGGFPQSNYLAYLGSTHTQHWWAAYDAGCTLTVTCDTVPSGLRVLPGSTLDFDNYFMYENDVSAASIKDATVCTAQTTPCNPSSSATVTQHWATSQAMVNDRITLFQGVQHQHGSNCETFPTCIASGTTYAMQFNGLTNSIINSNSCFGYTGSQTGNYGATNAMQGNMEQAVWGFKTAVHNGSGVEPRSMVHLLNCASQILANTNGQIKILDHNSLQTTYQAYYDDFAMRMLIWSNGRIEGRLGLEDATSVPILPVYPLQMLVPDPTSTGSPTMSKFSPQSCTNCDANGWDGSANTDGNFGSGCDKHDQSSDHGAVDLMAATVPKATNSGSIACNSMQDWKNNPVGVYVREFPKMDYNGYPITDNVNTPIGSAAQYMAVVLNLSNSTYNVACGDLPLEGGANYGHVVTATPSTPTAGSMDVVSGGSLSIATTFTCGSGTGSDVLAAESTLILVK